MVRNTMFEIYLKQIFEVAKRGDATESSYYYALANILQTYAESIGKKKIHITTLPKQTEAGNPDFRVWDGKQQIVGYIEAKGPSIEDLDRIEDTEQLKRYLHTFPNLILTNFFEFRLYRNGDLIDKVQIARPFILHELKRIPPLEKESDFKQLLEKFFAFSLPEIYSAKALAVELAKRTRFLRDEILALELKVKSPADSEIIKEDSPSYTYTLNLEGFYEAFQEHLINGLKREEFIDLYAQTITYGLFAARTRSTGEFNREKAYDNIPHTIGILREVFRFISQADLPEQMKWIIDDISEVLAVTDVNKILRQFFHEGKGKDPVVHFYETFLAAYDPKTREKRGVYYTPEPVVSYIVRSLHHILKEQFDRQDGFADANVTVLDPAAGTLTFLVETAKLATEEYIAKYGKGSKEKFIKDHILKNYYAFELMMAPYAIGHLKMSFLLEELGYTLKGDDRFKLYLTNTLEMEELSGSNLPGMASLSEESRLAGKVKKQTPILVIMGNPPYSVSSANKSDFIEKEMEVYKKDVKSERNLQPLSDDYIKFVRFAHWKIDGEGKGLIGMITNNSYLSGLIHRGMRKKLMESFNQIYILNLHGNSRIGEKCPDGSKDENVFDIMQGVSIALFVKNNVIARVPYRQDRGPKAPAISTPKVFYQDVYGLREEKYDYLNTNQIQTTKWVQLKPTEPYYFFVEKDFSGQANYDKFIAIPEIFKQYSFGITTARDHFVVGFTEEEIKQKMRTFVSNLPDDLAAQSLDLKDTNDWEIKQAREHVRKKEWGNYIKPYSYRPFDDRCICYLSDLIDRDRLEIMQNIIDKDNLALSLTRRLRDPIWQHIYTTQYITDKTLLSSRDNCYSFPLYLYLDISDKHLLSSQEPSERKANLTPEFVKTLSDKYGNVPTPEEIFYYIYAVLYSNIYRIRYAEFLKIDFPRVPFTRDVGLFEKMGQFGKRVVDLHLLNSPELDPPIAKFQGDGDYRVEKLKYEKTWVYINKNQYFEGIEKGVWEYQIGAYQVCDKWLKDRKGRVLSLDDIQHYCRVVTALQRTIEVQKEIDEIYHEVEKR